MAETRSRRIYYQGSPEREEEESCSMIIEFELCKMKMLQRSAECVLLQKKKSNSKARRHQMRDNVEGMGKERAPIDSRVVEPKSQACA